MRRLTYLLLIASLLLGTNVNAAEADEPLAALSVPRLSVFAARPQTRAGWSMVRSEPIRMALGILDTHRIPTTSGQARKSGDVGRSLLRGSRRARAWVCNSWHAYVRPSMGFAKVHRRVLWLIRCATDRWTVPGGYSTAAYIASRESGPYTWPWAENPSGSSGVFQIIDSTYRSWWSAFGERCRMHRLANNVYNARTNVLLSVWAMNAYGLGAWGMS